MQHPTNPEHQLLGQLHACWSFSSLIPFPLLRLYTSDGGACFVSSTFSGNVITHHLWCNAVQCGLCVGPAKRKSTMCETEIHAFTGENGYHSAAKYQMVLCDQTSVKLPTTAHDGREETSAEHTTHLYIIKSNCQNTTSHWYARINRQCNTKPRTPAAGPAARLLEPFLLHSSPSLAVLVYIRRWCMFCIINIQQKRNNSSSKQKSTMCKTEIHHAFTGENGHVLQCSQISDGGVSSKFSRVRHKKTSSICGMDWHAA